jgi:hypothetical protein
MVVFSVLTSLNPYAEANRAVLEATREAAAHACQRTFWDARGCLCYSSGTELIKVSAE